MTITMPLWLRTVLYVAATLGTPVVAYARGHGWIGDAEVELWSAEVAAAGITSIIHRVKNAPADATPDVVDAPGVPDDGAAA